MLNETPFQKLIREALEKQQQAYNPFRNIVPSFQPKSVEINTFNPFFAAIRKQKVFVSFDYDNDKHYKYLLEAWSKHPRFKFDHEDVTPGEINSNNISVIKAGLIARIRVADYTLVLIGKYANSWHKNSQLIGFRNWINFEISHSKRYNKKIVAVKLDRSFDSPEEILGLNASWAMSFTEDSIIKALDEAR